MMIYIFGDLRQLRSFELARPVGAGSGGGIGGMGGGKDGKEEGSQKWVPQVVVREQSQRGDGRKPEKPWRTVIKVLRRSIGTPPAPTVCQLPYMNWRLLRLRESHAISLPSS